MESYTQGYSLRLRVRLPFPGPSLGFTTATFNRREANNLMWVQGQT